jgi:hypothetical protein
MRNIVNLKSITGRKAYAEILFNFARSNSFKDFKVSWSSYGDCIYGVTVEADYYGDVDPSWESTRDVVLTSVRASSFDLQVLFGTLAIARNQKRFWSMLELTKVLGIWTSNGSDAHLAYAEAYGVDLETYPGISSPALTRGLLGFNIPRWIACKTIASLGL